MSSTSLPFEKQIRRLIIVDSISASANVTAFQTSAPALALGMFSENGTALVEGVPFYFAYKNKQGIFRRSDLIDPKRILTQNTTAPVDKVGATQVFTIGAVTEGKVYNWNLKINYASSEVNFTTIHASAKAAAGDTPTTIAQKLATQMAFNLANDIKTSTVLPGDDTVGTDSVRKNKYFTISVATNRITITEKDWILDGFKVGLKEFDQLSWNAELGSSFFEQDAEVTKVVTSGTVSKNKGYEVAAAEYYLQLHSQSFFGTDITTSIREELVADVNEDYHIFDMSYYDESVYDPQKSEKMITVASPEESVITAIETAMQLVLGTTPVEPVEPVE